MSTRLQLSDHPTRDDLRVFLERVQRVGYADVRLVTRGSMLAVFGCTQAPASLTDAVPVVLVSRGFGLKVAPEAEVDATVSARALLDRLARMGLVGLELELPEQSVAAAWAGVLPPHGGWRAMGEVDAASLVSVAEQGIARIAEALPQEPGEAVVRRIRAEVWGATIAPQLPAAAAFAATAMGFLRDERVAGLSTTLTWLRLSTSRGQVLVRRLLG